MQLALTIAFVALLVTAAVWDLRTQRLPNWLTMAGLAAAVALRLFMGGGAFVEGLAGAGLGLLVVLPFFILGALGGGDAKLLAAVGGFTGPGLLITALLASAVVGGVLAVAEVVRRKVYYVAILQTQNLLKHALTLGRSGERPTLDSPGALRVPYGLAIAVGSLAAWFLPLAEWIHG